MRSELFYIFALFYLGLPDLLNMHLNFNIFWEAFAYELDTECIPFFISNQI